MSFLTQAIKNFAQNVDIYVVVHERPDGDAMGSQVALTLYLREQNLNAFALQTETLPDVYQYFYQTVPTQTLTGFSPTSNALFIALDCGIATRIAPEIQSCECALVIDHHPAEGSWGKLRFINPEATSTCEILTTLLDQAGYKFDNPKINEALYLGLLTDSGNFSHSNVTQHTFKCAEKLIAAGVKPYRIIQRVFNNKTEEQLKLQAVFLSRIKTYAHGRIVISELDVNDYALTHTCHNDTEGLVNQLLSLKNAKIAVFLEKNETFIKCSLRSSDPTIAVNKVAQKYGGGGHICAAGAKIDPHHFNFEEFLHDLDTLLS